MSRRAIHLSRVIRTPTHTITSTACNRNRTTNDGMNIADRDEDVTCWFCLAILEQRAKEKRAKTQAPGATAMREWQPIETAPKDGTLIIVHRPIHDGDYIPRVGTDYWGEFGSYSTWGKSRSDTPPTHWMPMPDPPKESNP